MSQTVISHQVCQNKLSKHSTIRGSEHSRVYIRTWYSPPFGIFGLLWTMRNLKLVSYFRQFCHARFCGNKLSIIFNNSPFNMNNVSHNKFLSKQSCCFHNCGLELDPLSLRNKQIALNRLTWFACWKFRELIALTIYGWGSGDFERCITCYRVGSSRFYCQCIRRNHTIFNNWLVAGSWNTKI